MYFDTHAHYDDKAFSQDRIELIESFPQKGVDTVINVGADMDSSLASIKLAEKYPYIYAAVGVHPYDAENMCQEDIDTLFEYSKNKRVVAIGEIGLDYHYEDCDKQKQRLWFEKQLQLCAHVDLPVIIHSRDATEETLEIIKQSSVRKGVIHAFSGSSEIAQTYVNMGFYIGVGGVVTFKNAKKLVEVVEKIPLEHILLETDSPYLTPTPFRGQRNNSLYLPYVAEKISEIKNIDVDSVINQTHKNAERLFLKK